MNEKKIEEYFIPTPEFKIFNIKNSEIAEIKNYAEENGFLTAIIDGKSIKTRKEVSQTIGEQMYFPEYYGNNLDALEECLGDLDWCDDPSWQKGFIEGGVIIIKNSHLLLSDEDIHLRQSFIDLLERAHEQLYSPVGRAFFIKNGRMLKVFMVEEGS